MILELLTILVATLLIGLFFFLQRRAKPNISPGATTSEVLSMGLDVSSLEDFMGAPSRSLASIYGPATQQLLGALGANKAVQYQDFFDKLRAKTLATSKQYNDYDQQAADYVTDIITFSRLAKVTLEGLLRQFQRGDYEVGNTFDEIIKESAALSKNYPPLKRNLGQVKVRYILFSDLLRDQGSLSIQIGISTKLYVLYIFYFRRPCRIFKCRALKVSTLFRLIRSPLRRRKASWLKWLESWAPL